MSNHEIAGLVALVTGGAKNIGRAIALDLAAGGAHVMVSARADEAGLAETVRLIEAAGGKAAWKLADITDEASVAALVSATAATFGGLDCLVNNAAIRTEVPFDRMTLADFRAVTQVGLEGPFICCRAALASLSREQDGEHHQYWRPHGLYRRQGSRACRGRQGRPRWPHESPRA